MIDAAPSAARTRALGTVVERVPAPEAPPSLAKGSSAIAGFALEIGTHTVVHRPSDQGIAQWEKAATSANSDPRPVFTVAPG